MESQTYAHRTALFGAIAALHLAWSGIAFGDLVHLSDGSVLVGTVLKMSEGRLTVETDFSGTLSIDPAKISGITAKRLFYVYLNNAERAAGEFVYVPQKQQMIRGTANGDLAIDFADVEAIWHPDAAPPDPQIQGLDHEVEEVVPVRHQDQEMTRRNEENRKALNLLHGRIESESTKWTANLEMGLNGQTGTSETTAFNGRAETRRTKKAERLLAYIQGRYVQQDSLRSANEIIGGIELEVDMDKRWFAFGRIGLEFDEFEELDLRSTGTGGVGYFLVRDEARELKARVGVGYQNERFVDGTAEDEGILEGGIDYKRQISPWLLIKHSTTYTVTFDDPSHDYRIVAESSGAIPLDDKEGWKLKVGMRNEYDLQPRADVERLDTFYFVNLVHELFK